MSRRSRSRSPTRSSSSSRFRSRSPKAGPTEEEIKMMTTLTDEQDARLAGRIKRNWDMEELKPYIIGVIEDALDRIVYLGKVTPLWNDSKCTVVIFREVFAMAHARLTKATECFLYDLTDPTCMDAVRQCLFQVCKDRGLKLRRGDRELFAEDLQVPSDTYPSFTPFGEYFVVDNPETTEEECSSTTFSSDEDVEDLDDQEDQEDQEEDEDDEDDKEAKGEEKKLEEHMKNVPDTFRTVLTEVCMDILVDMSDSATKSLVKRMTEYNAIDWNRPEYKITIPYVMQEEVAKWLAQRLRAVHIKEIQEALDVKPPEPNFHSLCTWVHMHIVCSIIIETEIVVVGSKMLIRFKRTIRT